MKQATAAVLMLAICAAITAFTKSIKELCDKLIFKGFDIFAKTYPEHGFYIKHPRPELISGPYIRDEFDNIVIRK